MTTRRAISIPAIHRSVTIPAYCAAIRKAKANPDATFPHGLTTWWPTTGAQIVRQFRDGMHQRISAGVPYGQRGLDA